MKICFPVDQVKGLESGIFPSFRAAPALLIVDSDTGECAGIDASDGACSATPIMVHAIVCAGGIGRGMLNGLRSRGVRVFKTGALTVAEALTAMNAGGVEEVTEVGCCGGSHDHAHEHGHAHGHGHDGHGCCGSAGEGGGSCGCSH